ncbi:MAG: nitrous oxide reductase family maturation protein NosD [Candidatus Thorarchaeota archaeon]
MEASLENNTHYGLSLRNSNNNDIIGNNISHNIYGGIYTYYGDNNEINHSRIIKNDGYGIYMTGSDSNTLYENLVLDNKYSGILLETSDNNKIFGNDLCYNEYGAYLNSLSNGNIFYLNNFTSNFIFNAYQATANSWNTLTIGNYWNDYMGKDTNDDNIGDSAHNFGTGVDNFPIWWDAPIISLISPSFGENFEITPSFEIMVIEGVEDTIWYSLNNGLTNITSLGLSGTIDDTEWYSAADGPIHLIFHVNDSRGYMDEVSVDIAKITDIPLIEIILPTLNQEFSSQPPEFTITITNTSSIVSMWYTIDGGINNISFTELTATINPTAWQLAPEGNITLVFYAEDELGNIGSERRIIIKNLTEHPSETPRGIPGYPIIAIFGFCVVITFVLIKKKLKIKKF